MIYTLVLFLLLLCFAIYRRTSQENKAARRVIIIIMYLALASMSACRYEDGVHADFRKNYINTIRAGGLSWEAAFTISEEFLHTVLRKLCMFLFDDPQSYFFVTAFFIVGVFFVTYHKYSPDFSCAILAFYCAFGYFGSNNITRQFIAIALTMISWRFAIKKRPIPFALFILLATGFHVSAVVSIPLYFLVSKSFTRKTFLFYIFLGLIMVVLNRQVTALMQNVIYSGYGQGYGSDSSNPLRLIWTVLTIASIWRINRSGKEINCLNLTNKLQSHCFQGLVLHGSVLYCFFQLLSAANMLLFSRVASYFSGCAVLSILYAIETFEIPQNRRILKTGFVLLLIAWFTIMNYTGRLYPAQYMAFWQAAV